MKAIVLILILSIQSANGESRAGNGGDGLIHNGKIYLLDLLESGVEDNPYFNDSIQVVDEFRLIIEKKLKLKNRVTELFAQKISEIYYVDEQLALSALITLSMYSWRWVNLELMDIKDEDTPLYYKSEDLIQLAARKGNKILLSKKSWYDTRLSDEHKSALLLHEVFYAMINPFDFDKQSSYRVRELVGLIFTSDLKLDFEFKALVERYFPFGNGRRGLRVDWKNKVLYKPLESILKLPESSRDRTLFHFNTFNAIDNGNIVSFLKSKKEKVLSFFKDKRATSFHREGALELKEKEFDETLVKFRFGFLRQSNTSFIEWRRWNNHNLKILNFLSYGKDSYAKNEIKYDKMIKEASSWFLPLNCTGDNVICNR